MINPLCGLPSAVLAKHPRSSGTFFSQAASVQFRCAVRGCYRKPTENTFQSCKRAGNSCAGVSMPEEIRMSFHSHYSAAAYRGDCQVLRIGSDQAKGFKRANVGIGLGHDLHPLRDDMSMPTNRRSECSSVNEMKSALFFRTHKDRVVADALTETFAATCDPFQNTRRYRHRLMHRSVASARPAHSSISARLRITFMLASSATT